MKIKTIFLDMDGVVADWAFAVAGIVAGFAGKSRADILEFLSVDSRRVEDTGVNEGLIDNVMKSGGAEWWRGLPEISDRFPHCPTARSLYYTCSTIAPTYFLTAIPSQLGTGAAAASAGKILWLKDRLGEEFTDLFICRRESKRLLASPDRVLIDDFSRNTKEFIEHGGKAIQYKAYEQSTEKITDMLLEIARHA